MTCWTGVPGSSSAFAFTPPLNLATTDKLPCNLLIRRRPNPAEMHVVAENNSTWHNMKQTEQAQKRAHSTRSYRVPAVTGRIYCVQYTKNLFTNVRYDARTGIAWINKGMMIPSTNVSERVFYRIGVESP